ncbi:glycosyltransferase family 2 protein [Comamonas thiooxydans]|uniref:glycosyltransferase family 2 protein n=1 Tax=Comamonas thiooxydans TaxID=363952 RepID=UPI0001BB13FF|nr:glycosyltransferase family 2 protein [Comamonas thiooxydans]ACY33513.1 glycosyl transferase, family 2 [Comamonas thiooxydans]MDO1476899.1 glycosyltransferase family 2 protein [Comamonas thiooxydans]
MLSFFKRKPESDLPRLGIAAIFRNEFPYILEWLAYHRVIGVDAFFIADNESNDGSSELLETLDRLGYICRIPFPTVNKQPPQMPAYTAIMQAYANQVDWMAFIDADEFLMPMGKETIKISINRLSGVSGIGAIAVNWAIYGSAGHVQEPEGLVLENFPRRANKEFLNNHHYKSIVRCKAYESVDGNPHIFRLKDGWRYVHVNGDSVEHHAERGKGLSEKICWEDFRLNHYVVKSREEFERRKSPKGSATRNECSKGEGYFMHHDRNDVEEPVDIGLLDAIRAEILRIKSAMVSDGASLTERPMKVVPRAALFKGIRGHVDRISQTADMLTVRGWALKPDGNAPGLLTLVYNGVKYDIESFRRISRPDVQRHYPGATDMSGFEVNFSLSGMERSPRESIQIMAGAGGEEQSYPLVMPKDFN